MKRVVCLSAAPRVLVFSFRLLITCLLSTKCTAFDAPVESSDPPRREMQMSSEETGWSTIFTLLGFLVVSGVDRRSSPSRVV